MYGIYANIGGIVMGSMLPYIAYIDPMGLESIRNSIALGLGPRFQAEVLLISGLPHGSWAIRCLVHRPWSAGQSRRFCPRLENSWNDGI